MMRFKAILIASTSIAACTLVQPAIAQTAGAQIPDAEQRANAREEADAEAQANEIVVTAQRREQRLSDVGIAVSVATGDQLRTLGVGSSAELAKFTPGVFLSGAVGGQSVQYTVRAVSQSDFNDAIEAPIAVYLDDVYIPVQQGQTMALFDIDRVEILKGPQGTLFGRNATGGLVHTVISQPVLGDRSGYINGSYGLYNESKLEGALNLPLSETAAIRVSGFWHRRDNFWTNLYPAGQPSSSPLTFGSPGVNIAHPGGDSSGMDDLGGRIQLKFEPTDRLTIRLAATAARSRMATPPSSIEPTAPVYDAQGRLTDVVRIGPGETRSGIGPNGTTVTGNGFDFGSPSAGGTRPVAGGNWYGFLPPDPKDMLFSQDFVRMNRTSAVNTALHIDYDLGGSTLTSITGYQHYYKNLMNEVDGTPVNTLAYGTLAKYDTITQELRLAGRSDVLTWQVGGFYMHNRAWNIQDLKATKGSLLAAAFGGIALADTGADLNSKAILTTDSASLFGQVEWKFAPQLTLVAGGRIIFEHQNYDYETFAAQNTDDYDINYKVRLPGFGFLEDTFTDSRWQTLWAGKVQLEYRPTTGLMLYAGVNRGTKAGSYNSKLPDGTPPYPDSAVPYKAETLYNYEGGVKYSDRHIAVNASAYYYDYKDFQAFLFTNLNGVVSNVPAKIYGVELDATLNITRNLKVMAGGTLLSGKLKNYTIVPGILRDVKMAYAPERSFVASANYTLPFEVADGKIRLNAQVSYSSDYYVAIRNFDSMHFPSRTLADFNLGWENKDTGMTVSFYLKNAFDKRYVLISYDNTMIAGNNQSTYADPRTYGVNVGFKF